MEITLIMKIWFKKILLRILTKHYENYDLMKIWRYTEHKYFIHEIGMWSVCVKIKGINWKKNEFSGINLSLISIEFDNFEILIYVSNFEGAQIKGIAAKGFIF